MTLGLVLGGGGLVGMGYHAGALKALEEWGVEPGSSDLIVGTSAGAVMGAYLRAGWTPTDFFEYAHGNHPNAEKTDDEQKGMVRELFTPMYDNGSERARRAVGSIFAAASSRGLWRKVGGKIPVSRLRRAFPAGMYSTDKTRERLESELGPTWPKGDLYLCASDLYSGKRVAFGRPGAPEAPFHLAVLSSTAIPGVFPPVKIGGSHYVDGGVLSATSLDLAAEDGCEAVICVAPLGYRKDAETQLRDDLRLLGPVLLRAMFARSLKREVVDARKKGLEVLVIRPWLTDLKSHGTNSMRYFDRAALVRDSREGTLRLLEENADHPALKAFVSQAKKKKSPTAKSTKAKVS
jgi:NTE family protein